MQWHGRRREPAPAVLCPAARRVPRKLLLRRLLVALCALPWKVGGAELERAEIGFHGASYHYVFSGRMDADPAAVHAVVTDIERLARLNDDIVSSVVLAREGPSALKRRLLLRHCILVFCFDIDFVERVEFRPNGDVATTIVPGEGNFRRGHAVWHVESLDRTHTRVTVEAEQEPDFWIPPLLGHLVIARSFKREARETIFRIEAAAHEQAQ